tara:strand:+ start:599 stop:838 length:240 start_codon:yes stop_codon:yes gene_type:complete
MPRNHSVKQTIEMLKNGESEPILIGSKGNKKVFHYPNGNPNVKASKVVEPEQKENHDEIIRFDPPKDNNSHKMWYQFWK